MMNLQRLATDTGLSLAECQAFRMLYLKRHIQELSEDVAWLADDDTDELSPHFCRSVFEELVAEAKELRHLSFVSKPNYKPKAGTITDEMIQSARQYPIENLIEFDRSGKSLAFCHADNHPSLSWNRKSNKATCFPCNKSFNPIDVLVQRDGMRFIDAVKSLSH